MEPDSNGLVPFEPRLFPVHEPGGRLSSDVICTANTLSLRYVTTIDSHGGADEDFSSRHVAGPASAPESALAIAS